MNIAIMNSSYQIIWEKVIMNRHPEAKNLEQALSKESEIFGSVAVVSLLSENGQHSWETEATFIAEGYPCKDHSAYYFETQNMVDLLYQFYHGAIGRVNYYNITKILGRPITLEDILYFFSLDKRNYGLGIGMQTKNICGILLPSTEIVEWQLTKPLHEQSPETWKGIAKVVKKTESK